jgi:hypothetical protein
MVVVGGECMSSPRMHTMLRACYAIAERDGGVSVPGNQEYTMIVINILFYNTMFLYMFV